MSIMAVQPDVCRGTGLVYGITCGHTRVNLGVRRKEMIDRLINIAVTAIAVLLVLGAFVTPYLPTLVAVLVGGSEIHSIRDTGLPACVHALRWSEWRPNDGTVRYSDNAPPSARVSEAQVIAYRIAYARGLVSQYTFYQGRYRRADGSETIAPASGPAYLIGAWVPGIIALLCLQLALATLLFLWGVRRSRKLSSITPGQRSTKYLILR